MKLKQKLLALLLALVMLLCSCDFVPEESTTSGLGEEKTEAPTQTQSGMETVTETDTEAETEDPLEVARREYSRTKEDILSLYTLTQDDVDAGSDVLDKCVSYALASDLDGFNASDEELEELYNHIYTQSSIATVIYYCDTSDEKASADYEFAYDSYVDLYDLYMEKYRQIYNESPIRDEIFADWTEEEIRRLTGYSSEEAELTKENNDILVEFHELSNARFYNGTAELYARFVTNNNKIAELNGYDNYYDYATVNVYGRDYTREDLDKFSNLVVQHIVPNIESIFDSWYSTYSKFTPTRQWAFVDFLYEPFDTITPNYLMEYVNSCEGSMGEGLRHMFENKNVVFANSEQSHQSAFQTYFDELETPFCLFGYQGQSSTTLAHEMGHYYAALHNPDVTSFDVAETQSNSNEYLFMQFLSTKMSGANSQMYNTLENYMIYNGITNIVISTIIDDFEQEVYLLDSVEGYTSEQFDAIMKSVCEKYGGDEFIEENMTDIYEYWRYVTIEAPVYYISYATSQMAALNIFSVAKTGYDQAKAIYVNLVEETQEDEGFMEVIARIGLPNVFEKTAFENVVALSIDGNQ